uniref:hypothetical protein n=1 Tax=Thaumasiovibrio occultus TaxID=1891184 RepID=UPI000B34F378|nr:hypothetical protein [Thaumasiovibrio occultus]
MQQERDPQSQKPQRNKAQSQRDDIDRWITAYRHVFFQAVGAVMMAWAGALGTLHAESSMISLLGFCIFIYGSCLRAKIKGPFDKDQP